MHKVKRAIIMAAGKGQRMQPLTQQIPKPLVPVRGQPMIHSAIEALHQNGIYEIFVVVGHLKEQFSYLPARYPGLSLIENPWFDSCNNISSLYAARAHLQDVFILDGDQIIRDPSVLSPDFEQSGYNAVWTETETKEWLLTEADGIVSSCSRKGGAFGWQLFSISRWCARDGEKLRQHLELEFEQRNRHDIYWDDVPLFCHPDEYHLGIYPMSPNAVTEIDSLSELAELDPLYRTYEEAPPIE